MTSDDAQCVSGTEHIITVEATRVFRGSVNPEMAEHLTQDGVSRNILGTEFGGQGVPMELHDEIKRTFECSCGKKFRKGKTARNHLEQYRSVNTGTEQEER